MSNLPDDITEDEFVELMSKCGMIARDPKTNKFKTKLYTEANGQLKGDGLCHYIRVSINKSNFSYLFSRSKKNSRAFAHFLACQREKVVTNRTKQKRFSNFFCVFFIIIFFFLFSLRQKFSKKRNENNRKTEKGKTITDFKVFFDCANLLRTMNCFRFLSFFFIFLVISLK